MLEPDTQKVLIKGDDQNNGMKHKDPKLMAIVIGDNIQHKIEEKDLIAEDLAVEARVFNKLQAYISGECIPPTAALHRICKVLGCSLDKILPMNYDETDSDYLTWAACKTKVRTNLFELSDMVKELGLKFALLAKLFSEQLGTQGCIFSKMLQDNMSNLSMALEAKEAPSERGHSLCADIMNICTYAELIDYSIKLLDETDCLTKDMKTELRKELQNIYNKLRDIIIIIKSKVDFTYIIDNQFLFLSEN